MVTDSPGLTPALSSLATGIGFGKSSGKIGAAVLKK